METLSEIMVNKFLQRNIIDPTKQEIYKTGLMLIMADVINISLVLIMGILMKAVISACVYLIVFWTVRRFSGGFHAKTYGLCRVVTSGTFVAVAFIGRAICIDNHALTYAVACDVITIVAMLMFAPIKHPNKVLTERQRKCNRVFSLIATTFFSLLSEVLVLLHRKEGVVISLTLFAIAVLMYIGIIVNRRREVTENVENNR